MIMDARKKRDQSGQALIELIIFLPLMFGIYGMISGFANAINGSINQQKVTRAYYYFRVQNNSMVPRPSMGIAISWKQFGMHFIGWAEKMTGSDEGGNPYAACYQVSIPLTPATTDNCDTAYNGDSTSFIRVGTAYGVCGATFAKVPGGANQFFMIPDYDGADYRNLLGLDSCTIK